MAVEHSESPPHRDPNHYFYKVEHGPLGEIEMGTRDGITLDEPETRGIDVGQPSETRGWRNGHIDVVEEAEDRFKAEQRLLREHGRTWTARAREGHHHGAISHSQSYGTDSTGQGRPVAHSQKELDDTSAHVAFVSRVEEWREKMHYKQEMKAAKQAAKSVPIEPR